MKWFLFTLSLAISLSFILFMPLNKYEWMLTDNPNQVLPYDGNRDMYPVIAILPLLFHALIFNFVKSISRKKIYVVSIVVLLSIWTYRFIYIGNTHSVYLGEEETATTR